MTSWLHYYLFQVDGGVNSIDRIPVDQQARIEPAIVEACVSLGCDLEDDEEPNITWAQDHLVFMTEDELTDVYERALDTLGTQNDDDCSYDVRLLVRSKFVHPHCAVSRR